MLLKMIAWLFGCVRVGMNFMLCIFYVLFFGSRFKLGFFSFLIVTAGSMLLFHGIDDTDV